MNRLLASVGFVECFWKIWNCLSSRRKLFWQGLWPYAGTAVRLLYGPGNQSTGQDGVWPVGLFVAGEIYFGRVVTQLFSKIAV